MRIDGPTYGTAADTNPVGEVYTIHIPEPPNTDRDDWPTRQELADRSRTWASGSTVRPSLERGSAT